MATGADWMSAASFISMAGLISFLGRDGSYYLMGWTGGYVLLAMLFGPYLRKYGKFTIPQFIGDRYYSNTARVIALCLRHLRLLHLRGRPDARRRRGVLPLHGRRHQHRRDHRHGAGLLLRHPGRHEGHHLHPGGAVRRPDHRLPDPGHLHLHAVHRQPDPADGLWLSDHRRRRGAAERPGTQGKYLLDVLERLEQGPRLCRPTPVASGR